MWATDEYRQGRTGQLKWSRNRAEGVPVKSPAVFGPEGMAGFSRSGFPKSPVPRRGESQAWRGGSFFGMWGSSYARQ